MALSLNIHYRRQTIKSTITPISSCPLVFLIQVHHPHLIGSTERGTLLTLSPSRDYLHDCKKRATDDIWECAQGTITFSDTINLIRSDVTQTLASSGHMKRGGQRYSFTQSATHFKAILAWSQYKKGWPIIDENGQSKTKVGKLIDQLLVNRLQKSCLKDRCFPHCTGPNTCLLHQTKKQNKKFKNFF